VIAVILTLSVLCMVGVVLLALALLPVVFAYYYAQEEQTKEDAATAYKNARTQKTLADLEVLESRRALIDSQVAIKELQAEALREKMGYEHDPARGREQFNPINYDSNH